MEDVVSPPRNHPAWSLWRDNMNPEDWAKVLHAAAGEKPISLHMLTEWFGWAMETAHQQGLADGG